MRYLYLHGFASGPGSRKAQAFLGALSGCGIPLEIPDLAGGDFEHLTISGQLDRVERILIGEPARIIGSSMGGYLAGLFAARHPEVDRLVLLAPAFGFAARWQEMLGPEKLRAWQESGVMDVLHYGANAPRPLRYLLYQDALKFEAIPDFPQPARIFHGIRDAVVPVSTSREFVHAHQRSILTELDSDHELLSVLGEIVTAATSFLTEEPAM